MNSIATALVVSGLAVPYIALRKWNDELTGRTGPGRVWRVVRSLCRLAVTILAGLFIFMVWFGIPVLILLAIWHKVGAWAVLAAIILTVVSVFLMCLASWRMDEWR